MTNATEELYVHEQFKFGDRAKEIAEFQDHAERVRKAQSVLAAQHSSGNARRVFHAKIHACLAGTLRLIDDRPTNICRGIFGRNGKQVYHVVGRFSSGVGFDQHDLKPDVRGLALKIFGVKEASDADRGRERTVDFLMTNSTNPFGIDQEEFVQFMEANLDTGILGTRLIGFLIRHTEVARLLMKATLKIVPSLAREQYWSGHPYLLGPQQAMKFNVRPTESREMGTDESLHSETARFEASAGDTLENRIKRWWDLQSSATFKADPNYLSLELRERLKRSPIRFIFSVQLEKDEEATPIENGLIEWKESDSASIPVAEVVFDREVDSGVCETLRFTPGHYIPDHRPLGNLGRGRIFTYEASQIGRRAAAEEPREDRFFGGE